MVDATLANQVVIRAGSPVPVSREMATNGLRQLGALLPMVERQLVTSVVALMPVPLGHLARAMGDAAHQVGAGFAAMASVGSQSGADEAWSGAETTMPGGQAAAPSRLIVTGDEDGSKIHPPPFITKTIGPAPEAALAAPATDDGARLGKSPATVSKLPTSAAGSSSGKSYSAMDQASVRPGLAKFDLPRAVTSPSVTRPAAARQAAGAASGGASAPENARTERGSAGAARAADPGPRGHVASEDVAADGLNATAGWRGAARQLLEQTSDTLAQISERLQPTALSRPKEADDARPSVAPDLFWAMTQVAGAQRQVAASLAVLTGLGPLRRAASAGSTRLRLRRGDGGQLDPLTGAVAFFGYGLLLIMMALAVGLWTASLTMIGSCAGFGVAVLWGWRVSVGARGLRIALRR